MQEVVSKLITMLLVVPLMGGDGWDLPPVSPPPVNSKANIHVACEKRGRGRGGRQVEKEEGRGKEGEGEGHEKMMMKRGRGM